MEKMGFSCEAEHSGSSSHSGDPFSGTESERDILELESEAGTPAKRMKAFFADLNWKDVLTTSCLWLAYFLCNVAFSLIAPFFPEEVYTYVHTQGGLQHFVIRGQELHRHGHMLHACTPHMSLKEITKIINQSISCALHASYKTLCYLMCVCRWIINQSLF